MKSDLVTIAFPVFERFDYFEKALNSALNQTIPTKIIVIDNNSSHDKFKNHCIERNITYYRNDVNLGMFGNWNRCFEIADTEFVMILGDDDFLEPIFIEKFYEALNKNSSIDIWYSDFQSIVHDTGEIRNHDHVLPFLLNPGITIQEFGIKHSLGFPIISSIIRKNKFTGFYEKEHGSNDWVWLYENANNLVFYGENMKLLHYGSHKNQDSKNSVTHVKCMISISYIYRDILKNKVDDCDLKSLAEKRFLNVFFYFLAISSNEFIRSLETENHKYALFYRDVLSNSLLFNIFSEIPFIFRNTIYRVFRKIFSLSI